MKNFKKTLALVAALVMSATALYGCGDDKEDSKSSSTPASQSETDKDSSKESSDKDSSETTGDGEEGDKLTILCWNQNDSKPMVDLFLEKTGYSADQVNIQDFNCQGGQAAENYKTYLSDAANDADIMFLEADWALQFINDDDQTIPLSDLGFSEGDFGSLYPYVLEVGKSTTSDELKGVSWQAAAGGYCYRTDLAKEFLGVETPEDMQKKVANWDEFIKTAEEFSTKAGGGKSIAATLGGVWQVYSGSRGEAWVDADNKLKVDDYCKDYAEFAKKLLSNKYVTDVTQWTDAWLPLGQTDDVLGFFVSTWGFGDTILTSAAGGEGGKTYGKWNVVVGPQEFYWGGTWMAPATRCDNKKMAKEFIDMFTTDEESAKAYALKTGDYMSNKNVMKSIIDEKLYEGAGVLGGQNQFEVLDKVAQNIDMAGKITPYDSAIKAAFSSAVLDYADGTTASVDEAMEAFKDQVATDCVDVVCE